HKHESALADKATKLNQQTAEEGAFRIDSQQKETTKETQIEPNKSDREESAQITPSAAPTEMPEKSSTPATDQSPPQQENEESVDEYMARLLERIRSAQGEVASSAEKRNIPSERRADESTVKTDDTKSPQTIISAPVAQLREAGEIAPRSQAPENKADLRLLRNLANYQAQTALGTFARYQMTRAMYSKMAVAIIGGCVGMGLLMIWQNWYNNNVIFYAALLAFLVAVFWGIQYVFLTIRLLTNESVQSEADHVSEHVHKPPQDKGPNDSAQVSETQTKTSALSPEAATRSGETNAQKLGSQINDSAQP
ncbi:MAG: hypothetical protein ACWGMZ_07240, partial [Thermoguttaceae bacterium]